MGAMVHPGLHAAPGWSQVNAAVADWLGCIGLSMLVTWQLPLSHLDRYRCVCAGLGHHQEIFASAAALTEAQIPAGLTRGLIADRGDPATKKAGGALAACCTGPGQVSEVPRNGFLPCSAMEGKSFPFFLLQFPAA